MISDIGIFRQLGIQCVGCLCQKYNIFRDHGQPKKHNALPTQFLGGCNKTFTFSCLEKCGCWVVYSSKLAGVLNLCCVRFTSASKKMLTGTLINTQFITYSKKSEVTDRPANKSYHIAASKKPCRKFL